MANTSGTQAVAAAAVNATVPGVFVLPYAVAISTSWNTSILVSAKGLASFLVTFGTPAPAGGGTLDWIAISAPIVQPVPPPPGPPGPGQQETLSTYLVRVRRLLHDLPANYVPNPLDSTPQQYFSDFDLTYDINDALNERDLWSGGSRLYQANVPLTIGQDTYLLQALFPTLVQPVLDVIAIWLLYGNTRVPLDDVPFSTLTQRARPIIGFQNRPQGFARYGAGRIYIAPAPGAAYTCDFDLSVLSTTLVVASDADPLRYPYTKPIPYYAAYLAKLNQRRFDEAEVFFGYYIRHMRDIEGARVGQMPSPGTEGRRGARA